MANLERLRQAELLGQQKRAGLVAADARIPEREQQTIQKLGATPEAVSKLDPVTLFEATYTSDELKNIPAYQQALLNQSSSLTKQAYADKEQAQANLLATDKPTASKLRVLEDAIRTKAGIGQESIGTSETYDKLGISGYATLLQSLNQRGTEMNNRYNSFVDKFTSVSQGIKDQYSVVADKYKLLKNEYDKEVERFDKITYQISAQQHAMNMLERQDELNKEAREWQLNNPGAATSLNFENSGKAWVDGKVMPVIANESMASLDDASLQAIANSIMKVESDNGRLGAAAKNNNPGNIKMPGAGIEEARRRYNDPGATVGTSATDGGKPFIKFSSMDAGRKAVPILLKQSYYANKTVNDALKQWSSNGYGAEILGKSQGTASTKVSFKKLSNETETAFKRRLETGLADRLKKSDSEWFDAKEYIRNMANVLPSGSVQSVMDKLIGKKVKNTNKDIVDDEGKMKEYVRQKGTISNRFNEIKTTGAKELSNIKAGDNVKIEAALLKMYKGFGGLIPIETIIKEFWDKQLEPIAATLMRSDEVDKDNLAKSIKENNPKFFK